MSDRPIVIVTGSRSLAHDSHASAWIVAQLDRLKPALVVHGANFNSPDKWAAAWVKGTPCARDEQRFPAEWDRHGKAAGQIRNREMLDLYPNAIVVGVWDGQSRGAGWMLREARRRGMPVCSLVCGEGLFENDEPYESLDV